MEYFKSLGSFDWEAFSRSMSCTDDAVFLCWSESHMQPVLTKGDVS
jgi:hypothetical protein